jgi:hypothetical protein
MPRIGDQHVCTSTNHWAANPLVYTIFWCIHLFSRDFSLKTKTWARSAPVGRAEGAPLLFFCVDHWKIDVYTKEGYTPMDLLPWMGQ